MLISLLSKGEYDKKVTKSKCVNTYEIAVISYKSSWLTRDYLDCLTSALIQYYLRAEVCPRPASFLPPSVRSILQFLFSLVIELTSTQASAAISLLAILVTSQFNSCLVSYQDTSKNQHGPYPRQVSYTKLRDTCTELIELYVAGR